MLVQPSINAHQPHLKLVETAAAVMPHMGEMCSPKNGYGRRGQCWAEHSLREWPTRQINDWSRRPSSVLPWRIVHQPEDIRWHRRRDCVGRILLPRTLARASYAEGPLVTCASAGRPNQPAPKYVNYRFFFLVYTHMKVVSTILWFQGLVNLQCYLNCTYSGTSFNRLRVNRAWNSLR